MTELTPSQLIPETYLDLLRQDRGDAQDMEPVVHYRLEDMEIVNEQHGK